MTNDRIFDIATKAGVSRDQANKVLEFAALAPDRGDGRKIHYGAGRQPLDDIIEKGWAPEFCAGNVLKYLRRDKNRGHSIESARFYSNLLIKLIEADRNSDEGKRITKIYEKLLLFLTDDELDLLR